ncbi:hypothetical protein [Paucibacter soli]|uniref:hypothetical protein n=1 Tax=Paucibacter soli TaxID=3133433 RepID=UPI00309D1851
MQPLSTISRDDFLAISDLAISEAPSSFLTLGKRLGQLNATTKTEEMAGDIEVSGATTTVVTGLAISKLQSMSELETIYEFPPELQHPAEQVTVCLAMLRKMEEDSADGGDLIEPSKFTYNQVQRRLSRLLVDHPVMMDPRILVGVKTVSGYEFSTVPCAIAELSFGALPCQVHGLTQRELRIFTGKTSVQNGIGNASPQTTVPKSSVRGRTPLCIAFGNSATPAVSGATRGAFLASLLELSHLATLHNGRPLVDYRYRVGGDRDGFFKGLIAIFWDVATTGGRNSNLSLGQLAQTLLLPAPFSLADKVIESQESAASKWTVASYGSVQEGALSGMTGKLGLGLCASIDKHLFNVGGAPVDAGDLRDRTRGTIKLLAAVGLTDSETQAAQLLCRVAIGAGRPDPMWAGPDVPMESAFGFLDALHAYGVVPSKVGNEAAKAADVWMNALRIHSATKSMESVFAKIPCGMVAQPGSGNSGNDAPAGRARRNRIV